MTIAAGKKRVMLTLDPAAPGLQGGHGVADGLDHGRNSWRSVLTRSGPALEPRGKQR